MLSSTRMAWLSFCLCALLPGAHAFAEQKTWDGGGGNTDWNTAANWSPDGVPVATDDVLIGAAFPSVVHSTGTNGVATLNCAATVLTISGGQLSVEKSGTISGRLTVTNATIAGSGSITLTSVGNSFSSATLNGDGAVTIGAAAALSITNCAIARPLINDGALTMSGNSDTALFSGCLITNRGVWTMSAASGQTCTLRPPCANTSAAIINEGTMVFAGAGLKRFAIFCGPVFTMTSSPSSLVQVQAGVVNFSNPVTLNTTEIASGATLQTDATSTFNGAITGEGTFDAGGTTTINASLASTLTMLVHSGTCAVNSNIVRALPLNVTNATIAGSGSITLNAVGNSFSNATLSGDGVMTIGAAGTLSITNCAIAEPLINDGALTMSGNSDTALFSGCLITNRGVWTMSAASGQTCTLRPPCANTSAAIINEGTMVFAGAGLKRFAIFCGPVFTMTSSPSSLVQVQAGVVNFSNPVTLNTTEIASGATLQTDATSTFNGAITGEGTFDAGGTTTINASLASTLTMLVHSGTCAVNSNIVRALPLNVTNATIAGSGSITLTAVGNSFSNATLSGDGVMTIGAAGTLSITNCAIAEPLINDGALTMSGNSDTALFSGCLITNRGVWTMSAASGQTCTLRPPCANTSAAIINEGTMVFAGAGLKRFAIFCGPVFTMTSSPSSLVQVQAGVVNFSNPVTLNTTEIASGATLQTDATSTFNGAITGEGTFDAGGTTTINASLASTLTMLVHSGTCAVNSNIVRALPLNVTNATIAGSGSITLNAIGNSFSNATLSGDGVMTIGAAAALSITNCAIARPLINDGALTMSGNSDTALFSGCLITNRGVWTMSAASGQTCTLRPPCANTSAAIINEGTMVFAGAGLKRFQAFCGPVFTMTSSPSSLVQVQAGVVNFSNPVTLNTTEIASGATLQTDATSTFNGAITGEGTFDAGGNTTINASLAPTLTMLVHSGTCAVNSNIVRALPLNVTNATIAGSGSITLNAIGNSFSNATLSGDGAVTIGAAAALSITNCAIARPLINDGALTMSGNSDTALFSGCLITNRGVWTMSAASGQTCTLRPPCANTSAAIINEGTMVFAGAGLKRFQAFCGPVFTMTSSPSSLVQVQAGVVNFSNPVTLNTTEIASGATLQTDATSTFNGAITGEGTFDAGGNTTINASLASTLTMLVHSGTCAVNSNIVRALPLNVTNATLAGSGSITLTAVGNSFSNATLSGDGVMTIGAAGTLSITNCAIAKPLINDGALTMSGNSDTALFSGCLITNRGVWTMSAASGQTCTLRPPCGNTSAAIINEGTMVFAGAGLKNFSGTCGAVFTFSSTGTVDIAEGTARLEVPLLNFTADNRLVGGTWIVSGTLFVSTAIRELAATLELRGTGSVLNSLGSALQGLNTISAAGALRFVDAGTRTFAPTGGTLACAGSLDVRGASSNIITGALTLAPTASTNILASSVSPVFSATTGTLGGSFALAFDPSFAPSTGTTWNLANFPSGRSGAFASMNLPPDTTVDLTATAVVASIEKQLPVPDLASAAAVLPLSVSAGAPLVAVFTERNDGDALATAPWRDRVEFLESASSTSALFTLGVVDVAVDLAIDATAERTVTGVAPFRAGALFPRLVLDVNGDLAETSSAIDGEANNSIVGVAIEVLAANLVAGKANVPSSVNTTQSATILFDTRNAGPGDSIGGAFVDRVFLSLDAIVDSSDVTLGSVERTNAIMLNGATLEGSVTFTLPAVTPDGTYNVLLQVDATSIRFEESDADNVSVIGSVVVQPIPVPNLASVGAVLPASVSAGAPLVALFTERNDGNADAVAPWRNRVEFLDSVQSSTVIAELGFVDVASNLAQSATANRSIAGTAPFHSGALFPRLVLDTNNTVGESSGVANGEANNTIVSASIEVLAANLVAGAASVPSSILTTQPATILFDTTNAGPGDSIGGAFVDRVFLSLDATLGAGDISVGEVARGAAIIANGAILPGSVNFTLPLSTPEGTYNALLQLDATSARFESSETDNVAVIGSIAVQASPAPDLVLVAVDAPLSLVTNQPYIVRWTIRNNGSAPATGNWSDKVFRSVDAVFGSDVFLAPRVDVSGPLAVGAERTLEFALVAPATATQFFNFIVIDADAQVAEAAAGEANNVSAAIGPVVVTFPPAADLVVASITVPSSAIAGESIAISWTERNEGPVATSGSWRTSVSLSSNAIAGDFDDVFVADVLRSVVIKPSGESIVNAIFQVPVMAQGVPVAGNRFFIIGADRFNTLDERPNESNNSAVSTATVIDPAPLPDLGVVAVIAPATAIGQQTISTSWTVRNSGNLATGTSWRDQVWLSADTVLGGGDIMLAEKIHNGVLQPNEEYTDSTSTLLADLSGTLFVLVRTDALNQIAEGSDVAANVRASASPVIISAAPRADLVAAVTGSPTSAQAGDAVSVTWSGTNSGTATVTGAWTDKIFLSNDAILSGDDLLLRTQPVSAAGGGLVAGAQYARTASVQLPVSYEDSAQFLIAVCDALGVVSESDEANNVGASFAITVQATDAPDLVAEDLSTPSSGVFSQTVTINWTDRNQGSLASPGGFSDIVFLSTDAVLSSNDLPVAVVGAGSASLAVGAEAPRSALVQLPLSNSLPEGSYRLLVKSDGNGSIQESNENNNIAIGTPIALTRPALADLVASITAVPTEISFGESFTMGISIANNGAADLTANTFYTISAVGESATVLLAELLLTDDIAVGASVSFNRSVAVPTIQGGAFALKVCADSRDQVVEVVESNCIESTAITPRKPDLVVESIAAPTSATAGDAITITYVVRNLGNGAATGFRGDLVALSEDLVIGSDRTVSAPTVVQTIAAGATINRTVNFTIPSGIEGVHRFVVTVDSTNSIEESVEGASNSLLLTASINIDPAPRPNLAVIAASAPASTEQGQRISISYTVRNQGLGVAEGGWSDAVYATRLDGAGFVRLGAAAGPSTLAADTQYARTVEYASPTVGVWRISVVTDDSESVTETDAVGGSGETDNSRIAQASLLVAAVEVTASVGAAELALPTPTLLTIEARSQSTGELVGGVSGTRITSVDGFPTTVPFITASNGRAIIEVAPVANNAGVYGFGAIAGNATPPVQTQVLYWGVKLLGDTVERRIAQGGAASGQLFIQNLGEIAIDAASLTVETIGEGVAVTASLGASTLGSNETRFIDYSVNVSEISEGGTVRFTLTTPKTTPQVFEISVLAIEALPVLVANPASINRDMLVGDVDFVNVTVTNTGPVTSGSLVVLISASPFAELVTPQALAPLAPGASTVVTVRLAPAEDLVIGPYTANPFLTVTDQSNDGLGVGVAATFNATTNATSTVKIRCTDEFSFYATPPTYPTATVELLVPGTNVVVAGGLVDPDGRIEFARVPEGNYTLRAVAPQHGGAQQSVYVSASGLDIELFMSRVLVTYQWTVVPTGFNDQYTISISLIFETNVPAPVVTVEPVVLDLDALDGEVSYREFTITNHGLVGADNAEWGVENTDRYDIIPLSPTMGDLLPGQSIVAPFLVIDREFGQGQFNGASCIQRPALKAMWELLCGNTLGKYSFLVGIDKTVECPQGSGPVFNGCAYCFDGGLNGGPGFPPLPGAIQPSPPVEYKGPNCEECFDKCIDHFIPCGSAAIGAAVGGPAATAAFINCVKGKLPKDLGDDALESDDEEEEDDEEEDGDGGDETVGDAARDAAKSAAKDAAKCLLNAGLEGNLNSVSAFGDAALGCGQDAGEGALEDLAKKFPGGAALGAAAKGFQACNCLGNQAGAGGAGGGSGGGGPDPLTGADAIPSDLFLAPDRIDASRNDLEEYLNAGLLAIRMLRPFAYEMGDFDWWNRIAGPLTQIHGSEGLTIAELNGLRSDFIGLYMGSILDETGSVSRVDGAELAALQGFFAAHPDAMADRSLAELDHMVSRWNRTRDYYDLGIFTVDDVPAGMSIDFIDRLVLVEYISNAALAVRTVEESGYEGLNDLFGSALQVFVSELEPGQGLCTTLRLQLDQTLTLERQAFEARLLLDNETEFALESLRLDFTIVDANGAPAGERFVVLGPTLEVLTAVDGTGTLAAGATGTATFMLIPGDSAAPTGPTVYKVNGTLSYAIGGQTLSFPLFPAQITVLPNPSLELNYFIETQVYGDDPFTAELEPSVPFALGLWAKNAGGGTAGNVRIESGEPIIMENERNLLIDFDLLGSQVGTEQRSPSLAVDLGDIGAGEVRVAQWLMSSTIQGEFVDYEVEISSLNGFNTPEFAVVDSATIEPLVRAVRADVPLDDFIPDFLVNQLTNINALPDRIYLSEGAIEPVTAEIVSANTVSTDVLSIDAGVDPGWRYIRMQDPSGGAKRIASVIRDDGRVIQLGTNTWQTKFIDRSVSVPVLRADIHIFDRGGSGLYTLTYDPDNQAPFVSQWASVKSSGSSSAVAAIPFVAGKAVSESRTGGLSQLVASFSEPINPVTFDATAISLAAFDATGTEVAIPPTTVTAALTLGGTGAEIAFAPPLASGRRYCVRIVGAADAAGNVLTASTARLDISVATGDVTGDLRTNVTDFGALATLVPTLIIDRANPLEVRCDIDRDGDIDSTDVTLAMAANGTNLREAVNPCSTFVAGSGGHPGAVARPGDSPIESGTLARTQGSTHRGGGSAGMTNGGHGGHGGSDAPAVNAEVRIANTGEDRRVASILALRPQPEAAVRGDGVALETVNISDLVSAFALSEVGMRDGWILVDVPLDLSSPAHVTELSAMLVDAGAEVGIVVGSDDGLGRVIGPSFTMQFRAFAPLSWHARVLATLSGFTVSELGDGVWSLCARSHCGADAWSAMQQLKLRRDIEWVAPTDAQQNAMNQTGEGAHR